MADTPGKVISSFTSHEKKSSSFELGGCAGVFFQFLDRFNGKKLIPHKLLPSERPKQNIINHAEEKLTMAKLLLIADENRIGSSSRNVDSFSDSGAAQRPENHERQGKKAVSVVARLMGLETMPSPEPVFKDRKQIELFRNNKEAQSTKKLLQSKHLLVEKATKSRSSLDLRIQTLRRRMEVPHKNQLQRCNSKIISLNPTPKAGINKSRSSDAITRCNSKGPKDSKAMFFSKIPSMPSVQVESPLRSILSPSKTSNKLMSPIKSPLSTKSTARLFGAAAKVLEPSLRTARHLGYHSQTAKEICGKTVTLLLHSVANTGAQNKTLAIDHHATSEQKGSPASSSESAEGKSPATSRCSNASHKNQSYSLSNLANVKQSSSSKRDAITPLQGRYDRKLNDKLGRKIKLGTPTVASTPTVSSRQRVVTLKNNNSASTAIAQVNGKLNDTVVVVPNEEEKLKQDGVNRKGNQLANTRSEGSNYSGLKRTKAPSSSTFSHPSTRNNKSLQRSRSPSQNPSELSNQNVVRNTVQTSSLNIGKMANPCKVVDKSSNSAEIKGPSSFTSRPSQKRKAINLPPKPTAFGEILTSGERQSKTDDFGSRSVPQNFSEVQPDMACGLGETKAANTSETTDSVSRVRARARWDVADERKKNLMKDFISCCEPDRPPSYSHSSCRSVGRDDGSKMGETAVDILQELLISLNASSSQPSFHTSDVGYRGSAPSKLNSCECESETFDHNFRGGRRQEDFLSDSSTVLHNFLGASEQMPGCHESFSPREDSCLRDYESVSDSLCAEECGQPSPISILESPFQDTASSSSDSFEALQGRKLCEVNANELSDCASTTASQAEYVFCEDRTLGMGVDAMCELQCIDSRALDVDIMSSKPMVNEEGYVKKIVEASLASIQDVISGGLPFSGPLIDPALFYKFEQSVDWQKTMPSDVCMEHDCRKKCRSLEKEAALQRRKLLFDCIEEALSLSVGFARHSYGYAVLYMPQSRARLCNRVYKQIGEWKGLASSMNLDDMMENEISASMAMWDRLDDEVERIAANLETVIFRGLLDDLMTDIKDTASFTALPFWLNPQHLSPTIYLPMSEASFCCE